MTDTTGKLWRRRREGSRSGGVGRSIPYGDDVKIPKLKDGQIRCASCLNVGKPTKSGRMRAHKDLFDNPCMAVGSVPMAGLEVPDVKLNLNHTKPDGHCKECGVQIMPMRRLCGRCFSKRS